VKPLATGLSIVILVFFLVSRAPAQSKIEIFAGYSAERIAPCGTSSGEQSCNLESGELRSSLQFYNGWNAAATWDAHASRPISVGLTADFSGHYGAFGGDRYNFLFGPTVPFHLSRLTPFAHALFGIARQSTSPGILSHPFTVADFVLGGGADMSISRHFAARLTQIDYERQASPTNGIASPQGIRLATGIVVGF
jgi:hypothetical protein